ncbi:HIT domain-containing protein [Pseudoalteromonas sp. NZS11]|uniref:HIT domain-containing protein n=1 Tax=Pseudoalteromonas sp. NZS11 TaxID=2792049 RepID=UPI0018CDAD9B|nr:HIT domain-containing protein [Pseudoalteromonas sp. NZS11]MBH0078402.1 HIT domain-containing protein [Pseudoalteromonas sp. NZS11]
MTNPEFKLAPELKRDCIELADWPLCKVLLLNDSQYPWFVLVPRQANLKEIIDLSEDDQIVYLKESAKLSKLLMDVFSPDKLNIAALGNMVPQLHIHHIARFTTDAAWPAPIWGKYPAVPYTDVQIAALKKALQF